MSTEYRLQKCLVTGADGFIGRALCRRLKRDGVEVVGLGRGETGEYCDAWVRADLSRPLEASSIPEGVDTVFHLAGKAHALSENAQDAKEYDTVNHQGTRHMLAVAKERGVRGFVLFSTIKVYGESTQEMTDEDASPQPQTPYGQSKLFAEKACLESELEQVSVLRLSAVYGPGSKGNVAAMIRSIRRGRFVPFQPSDNALSMADVEDVVQAALLAACKPEAHGKVFNVTDGTPYNPGEMVRWIYEACGKRPPPVMIPRFCLAMMGRVGDGISRLRGRRFFLDSAAVRKLYASAIYSNERLVNDLGFEPRHHLRERLPALVND